MTNKLTCPSCNKSHDLSDYIYATDADMAFKVALTVNPAIAEAVLKYTSLFAPAKSAMSLNRRAKVIESMDLGACEAERVSYGINTMLERHANGELTTPLKNHNYLKKVMTSYTPEGEDKPTSKTYSVKQLKFLTKRLCEMDSFMSENAGIGETRLEFETRIAESLKKPEYQEKWQHFLDQID